MTMRNSRRSRTLRIIYLALGVSLFTSTSTLAQETNPELCALTLQNVQQICSTPARNPKLAAMPCATAQLPYISMNCNVSPPSDLTAPPEAAALAADDDDGSHE